ncbi:MAG: purine-binding chemotaxis protein CheW [Bryobacterales bacterium]|nr:purine-binding chemotaxis protein CheW [Bryobacterales bacterium]
MSTQTGAAAGAAVLDTGAQTGSQCLSFRIGEEEYGIDILRVQEIKGYSNITRIPNTPPHIKGVINLRGAVVPVVDLRAKFSMELMEYTKFTVIILVAVASKTMGLIVDAVSDVLDIKEEDIQAPPELGVSVDTRFMRGMTTVNERLVAILDVDRLLGEDLAAAGGVD